jgi:hypothetical protein
MLDLMVFSHYIIYIRYIKIYLNKKEEVKMIVESIINKKGIEIKLGDVVVAKGSKIERVVKQISTNLDKIEIWGVRVDGLDNGWSKWLDGNELKIVKK